MPCVILLTRVCQLLSSQVSCCTSTSQTLEVISATLANYETYFNLGLSIMKTRTALSLLFTAYIYLHFVCKHLYFLSRACPTRVCDEKTFWKFPFKVFKLLFLHFKSYVNHKFFLSEWYWIIAFRQYITLNISHVTM